MTRENRDFKRRAEIMGGFEMSHTPGAVRAAEELEHRDNTSSLSIMEVAQIIDDETGLKELILYSESCLSIVKIIEVSDPHFFAPSKIAEFKELLEAALRRAKGLS